MVGGKARYILNSAVLTDFGVWEYRPISVEDARSWLEQGGWVSTIRYEETALALSQLTGVSIPSEDRTIRMEAGDQALVFRLVFPRGTPRVPEARKGLLTPHFVEQNSELGLLTRHS